MSKFQVGDTLTCKVDDSHNYVYTDQNALVKVVADITDVKGMIEVEIIKHAIRPESVGSIYRVEERHFKKVSTKDV